MSCENYKKLIEKYLDGIINDTELGNLKSHAENCSACRNEFKQSRQLQCVIAEGMSVQTTSKEAREAILSRLTDKRIESAPKVLFAGRMAVAASILIAFFISSFESSFVSIVSFILYFYILAVRL